MVEAVFSLIASGFVAVCAWSAVRPVSWKEVLRFCIDHQLPLDDSNAPIVTRLLATRRAARMTGTIIGVAVPLVLPVFGVRVLPSGTSWATAWIGYFAGALYGAWTNPHAPAPSERRALLVPRQAGDYLSRTVLILPVVTASIAAIGLALDLAGYRRQDAWIPGRAQVIVPFVLALLVALVSWATVRRVVGRRQDASTPLLVATDDALRSDALQIVTGAGVAMISLLCAMSVISAWNASSIRLVRWTFPWLGLGMWALSLRSWFMFRRMSWPVRRAALVAG